LSNWLTWSNSPHGTSSLGNTLSFLLPLWVCGRISSALVLIVVSVAGMIWCFWAGFWADHWLRVMLVYGGVGLTHWLCGFCPWVGVWVVPLRYPLGSPLWVLFRCFPLFWCKLYKGGVFFFCCSFWMFRIPLVLFQTMYLILFVLYHIKVYLSLGPHT